MNQKKNIAIQQKSSTTVLACLTSSRRLGHWSGAKVGDRRTETAQLSCLATREKTLRADILDGVSVNAKQRSSPAQLAPEHSPRSVHMDILADNSSPIRPWTAVSHFPEMEWMGVLNPCLYPPPRCQWHKAERSTADEQYRH